MEPWEWLAIARGLARKRWRWAASALVALVPRQAPGLGTFAVTGQGFLLWDPVCQEKWTMAQAEGAFIHEISHVLRDHLHRIDQIGVPPNVGNLCFPAGTPVDGHAIEEWHAEERIQDHQGQKTKILVAGDRRFEGDLVQIRASSLLPVAATPEHPFLISRRPHGYPVKLREPEWIPADEIEVGDYVYYPIPRPLDERPVLKMDSFIARHPEGWRTGDRTPLKNTFPLNEDTAWLLGLWTAEGSVTDGGETALSVGKHERSLARRAIAVTRQLGYRGHIDEGDHNLKIGIGDPVLGRALVAWCGRGAKNKHVPEFILRHPDPGIRHAYFTGVWEGDGFESKKHNRQGIAVASRTLALGIQALIATLGNFGTIHERSQKPGRVIRGRVLPGGLLWYVTWCHDLKTTARFLNEQWIESHSRHWRVTGEGVALPVRTLSRIPFAGDVFNFTTESETYTVAGYSVHNCADLSVNCMLKAIGVELPPGAVYPEQFGFPENLPMEDYARRLMEMVQPPGSGGGCKSEGESNGEGNGEGTEGDGGEGDGESEGESGSGKEKFPKKPTCGGGWCGSAGGQKVAGEPSNDHPHGRSDANLERLRRGAAEAIREAAAKNPGSVPGDWAVWADSILKPPKVDWRKELARVARAHVGYARGMFDYTWTRPSRRQAAIGYGAGKPILPALYAPEPSVAVIVDTSGSMGPEEGEIAISETVGVLKAIGCRAELCVCDAEVHALQKVQTPREVAAMMKGGGGTDLRRGIDELAKRRPRPSVVVILTDGYTPMYEEAPRWANFIFVLVGKSTSRPCTWGTFIEVPS